MSDPTFGNQFGLSVQADILRQAEQDRRRNPQSQPDDNLPLRPRAGARDGRVRPSLGSFGWWAAFTRSRMRVAEWVTLTPWTHCINDD